MDKQRHGYSDRGWQCNLFVKVMVINCTCVTFEIEHLHKMCTAINHAQ